MIDSMARSEISKYEPPLRQLARALQRIKEHFPRLDSERGFSEKDAQQAFLEYASRIPEKQQPTGMISQGQIVRFDNYRPGTILREQCCSQDPTATQWRWWCVGEWNKCTGKLELYEAKQEGGFEFALQLKQSFEVEKKCVQVPLRTHPEFSIDGQASLRHLGSQTPQHDIQIEENSPTVQVHIMKLGKARVDESGSGGGSGLRFLELAKKPGQVTPGPFDHIA